MIVQDILVLQAGLSGIGNLKITDFKLLYTIERNLAKVNSFLKAYGKAADTIRQKYVMKDKKGDLQTTAGHYDFETPEIREKFDQEITALNETKIENDLHKINVSAIEAAKIDGLTVNILLALHPILIDDDKLLLDGKPVEKPVPVKDKK